MWYRSSRFRLRSRLRLRSQLRSRLRARPRLRLRLRSQLYVYRDRARNRGRCVCFGLGTPLLVVAFLLCLTSVSSAGPNENGYLILHTDDSVTYTWDDVASYSEYTIPVCPWLDCSEPGWGCDGFLWDIDVSSDRPAEEPAVFWVIAAFSSASCPRVRAVAFGVDWEQSGNEPTFVGWGSCGDWELSQDDWPTAPHSGTVVAFSATRPQQAIPIYWFAAFSYYGETTVRLTSHPSEGEARFADDSVPARVDRIPPDHLGSMGLGGARGSNTYYQGDTPVLEASWGEVKSQFRPDEQ